MYIREAKDIYETDKSLRNLLNYLQQQFETRRDLFTFVEVPEEEEFAPTCRGGADMTKQVDTGIPEHTVKT